MRPTPRLLRLLGSWVLISLCLAIVRPWVSVDIVLSLDLVWWMSMIMIIAIIVSDLLLGRRRQHHLDAERRAPASLAIGIDNAFELYVENASPSKLRFEVTDEFPDEVEVRGLPRAIELAPSSHATVRYEVHPVKRGDAHFGRVCLRLASVMGFWDSFLYRGVPETVRVYPNFRSIANFRALDMHHHVNQLGIHLQQKRGQGLDFHQLREFRDGDAINQVDWKASARMRKLISREYQDERDQDIIFALDCGRRMHAIDGGLSHFDHVLNAFLLTSYVALRQGDAVGLMTFAGEERWLQPLKGQHAVTTLLNHVYDLHSSTNTSDFLELAEAINNRRHKRSLVVLITNLQDQDADDLLMAVRLLSTRHAVIVANLKESFLRDNLGYEIEDFDSALEYAGTVEYASNRYRMLQRVRKHGVAVADAIPSELHISLINEYLAMKRRGAI